MAADITFAQNDTIPSHTVTIKDKAGSPVDLTNAIVLLRVRASGGGSNKFTRLATIINATSGQVRFNWEPGDWDTIGSFFGEVDIAYYSSQLLLNPTMTTDANADGVADNWIFNGSAATKTIDAGQKISVATGSAGGDYSFSQIITGISAGEEFNFCFQAKMANISGGDLHFVIRFLNASDQVISSYYGVTQTSLPNFTVLELRKKIAPINTTKISLQLYVHTPLLNDTITAWFKDAALWKTLSGGEDAGPEVRFQYDVVSTYRP